MVNGNDRHRGAAGGSGGNDGPAIPPIKNPAVGGARPRRNYWLPWVLLGLAILGLVFMLAQCGRDKDEAKEAVHRDRAIQQEPGAGAAAGTAVATETVPAAPGTYRQGTLPYDVNQYLISNARRERTFTFGRLNFAPGSAALSGDQSDIAELAQVLSSRPGVRAAVVGYADGRGDETANARLGAERAGAVIAALRQRGVDTSNIDPRTGGERNRASRNDSARALAENRRTEFILLPRQ